MKTLGCKDLGVDCHFVAEAETAAAVKQQLNEHAMTVHKDKMEMMTEKEKQDMDMMMDKLMREV